MITIALNCVIRKNLVGKRKDVVVREEINSGSLRVSKRNRVNKSTK